MSDEELYDVADLRRQIEDLKRENDRLTEILGLKSSRNLERPHANQSGSFELESPLSLVDRSSSPESKVALFQSLFVGRDDVYALRWESATDGKARMVTCGGGRFCQRSIDGQRVSEVDGERDR